MRGAILYGRRDLRFEEREAPIIRISATCVCGSDLWPYRGLNPIKAPTPMGHEYCGIVEEVGSAVTRVKTLAASAANQPVPITSDTASRFGTRSPEGISGVAASVPSASGTRSSGA